MDNCHEKLIKPDEQNEFKTGLCSCFNNVPLCFAVLCCKPCMWGRIAHKTKFMGIKGQYWTSLFVVMAIIYAGFDVNFRVYNRVITESTAFHLWCIAFIVVFAVTIFLTRLLRARVRKVQNISGNWCNDGLVSAFCFPCAVCQMSSEVGLDRDACNVCYFPESDIVNVHEHPPAYFPRNQDPDPEIIIK